MRQKTKKPLAPINIVPLDESNQTWLTTACKRIKSWQLLRFDSWLQQNNINGAITPSEMPKILCLQKGLVEAHVATTATLAKVALVGFFWAEGDPLKTSRVELSFFINIRCIKKGIAHLQSFCSHLSDQGLAVWVVFHHQTYSCLQSLLLPWVLKKAGFKVYNAPHVKNHLAMHYATI